MSRPGVVRLTGPRSARPLILSNALGTTSRLWDPQLGAFATEHRVVVYEAQPRSTVEALARDVLAMMDDLGFERFSFCGLSLGGMVGMWLGLYAPDRVEKLVLAATSARFGSPDEWHDRARLVRREGMDAVARDALDKWFTPRFADREPFLRMQLGVPPEDYGLGLEAIAGFDFRERLGDIRAPTLVIVGAKDPATTPADARYIAERVPSARLVVLEDAAHLVNVEQPEAFAQAVLEHLRE